MYLGRLTPAAVFDQAVDSDPKRQRAMQCEAYFYVGYHLLIEGKRSEAAAMFQRAVATGVTEFIEYQAARAQLSRLGF
jgi:lipoprotein NlpI